MVQNSWVNLTQTNRGSFPVGTVLKYSCDPGYMADGPSILTCTTLGRWSSEPPHCIHSGGKIFSTYCLLLIWKVVISQCVMTTNFFLSLIPKQLNVCLFFLVFIMWQLFSTMRKKHN